MSAVDIVPGAAAYRAAIAELPVSARAAVDMEGAIAVVDGAGTWWSAALAAIADGAVGIVVARPQQGPDDAIAVLAASGVPVVVERPLLRADVSAEAVASGPRSAVVTVECHAPSLATALRDAVGWGRVLAGGLLELRDAASTARSRHLALLEGPAGQAVSLIAGAAPGAPDGGRVRATGVGETLLDVDGDASAIRLATVDRDGRRVSPRRWEGSERLALRRAIVAVTTRAAPSDLTELAHDERLAEGISGAARA